MTLDDYRQLFDGLAEAHGVVERATADDDYRFVEVNAAFEVLVASTVLRGKSCRHAWSAFDARLRELFDRVVQTGRPERFVADDHAQDEARKVDGYAYRLGGPERRRVAVQLADVTERIRVDEDLRARLDNVNLLVEKAPLGVFLVDEAFRLLHVNALARAGSSEDVAPLIGQDFEEILLRGGPSEQAMEVLGRFRHTLATGEPFHQAEVETKVPELGITRYTDWRLDRIDLQDGSRVVVCYFTDVTHQVEARRALAASEARYRALFETMDEGFCILELAFDEADRPLDARFLEINPAFERQSGVANALGRTMKEVAPNGNPTWLETYGRVARTQEPKRFVDHSPVTGRWYENYAFPFGDPTERKVAVLFNDVTVQKAAEEALQESLTTLRHHAQHDHLTGLPNRALFDDRLQLAVEEARRHGRTLAVLFVDLDDFKRVNDEHGHAVGDAVLVEVARRMRGMLRASDTLARMHGDEFVVLLPEIAHTDDAEALAQTLLTEVAAPIEAAGQRIGVSASVGVSFFPRDALDPSLLLRSADAAMYEAKAARKNVVRFFGAAASVRKQD